MIIVDTAKPLFPWENDRRRQVATMYNVQSMDLDTKGENTNIFYKSCYVRSGLGFGCWCRFASPGHLIDGIARLKIICRSQRT